MFTASDIDQLRASMPECDFAADALSVPALLPYLQFYDLDPRQLPAPSGAAVRCSAGSFDAAGFRIFCQSFTFSPGGCRGTVFVLHGYYDHGGLYGKLLRYLLLKGYAVVLFDLPGHGLSSGDRAAITSFAQYTDVLDALLTRAATAALPAPWHLVGQSTGGTIAMDYCLRHCAETAPRVDKVVLLAPLVRPHQWWHGSLLHSVLKHVVEGIPRNFVDNSHDTEFLHFLREEDPLQSRLLSARWVSALKEWLKRFEAAPACTKALFVVQGTGDTTVDWHYNLQAIARKFPLAHIETISEARHHLVNESPPYREHLYGLLDSVFQY